MAHHVTICLALAMLASVCRVASGAPPSRYPHLIWHRFKFRQVQLLETGQTTPLSKADSSSQRARGLQGVAGLKLLNLMDIFRRGLLGGALLNTQSDGITEFCSKALVLI